MRFLLTEHHWVLDSLFPGEWEWLCQLPDIAAGKGMRPEALERLYPSPLAPDVLAEESTLSQTEDWKELIHPEMAESFAAARSIVAADLARSEASRLDDYPEDDPIRQEFEEAGIPAELLEMRRILVPAKNTEAWYSTLNQARLLMNEEYGLATAPERHGKEALTLEGLGEDRLLLIAQYELYSVVQSILVENVMQ